MGKYSLEVIMIGATYIGRRLCLYDIHVEVNVFIPTWPFQCEQCSSLRRQRQIRHHRNEMERVGHGSSVAFRIALFARQRDAFASAEK